MKQRLFISFFVLIFGTAALAESSNPVFPEFNAIIQFDKLTVENVKSATDSLVAKTKRNLEAIYNVPAQERSWDNTMLAIDDLYDELRSGYGIIYLMGNTHPGDEVRNQCNERIVVLQKYYNELGLDEELYRSVKEYAAMGEAKTLAGYKEKLLRETLRDFRRNGFDLSKEKREELKELQDTLSDLTTTFGRNIAEYQDSLIVDEATLAGLDDDYKEARKTADGMYKLDLTYPTVFPFLDFAESDETRKALSIKYRNRAADKNIAVLKEVLINRRKLATLLGYPTYAAYVLETRMAKNPKTVWEFENSLIAKVRQKAGLDYQELLSAKRAHLNDPTIDVVNAWESRFYNNILLRDKYNVDQKKVKEYFELNSVLGGLFQITQSLFDVKYVEVESPSVWHEDVRLFEVRDDGKTIGRFYLDLHPRANKYTHAACFPIVSGKTTDNGYQIPTASLVCNFPRATESRPALMSHDQVETFFHEFGHVLHSMLTTVEVMQFSGSSVSRDFVEAPSQIFENWTWHYESLRLFAKHYETGEVLPKALFDKMLAARNVNSGNDALAQIYYGVIDMTLHDKFDPNGTETTTEVVKRLNNEITLFDFLEGTAMHASFGHLMGYAAGYYGYKWSEVYAADMFSAFEEEGILNSKVGQRYRDIILAKGGSEEPLQLVKDFLGREPNDEAFLRSLGLTGTN